MCQRSEFLLPSVSVTIIMFVYNNSILLCKITYTTIEGFHQISQRDANDKYSFLVLGEDGRLGSSRIGC